MVHINEYLKPETIEMRLHILLTPFLQLKIFLKHPYYLNLVSSSNLKPS